MAGMSDQVEIKEENYVHKNRISNEKLSWRKKNSELKTENTMPLLISIIL